MSFYDNITPSADEAAAEEQIAPRQQGPIMKAMKDLKPIPFAAVFSQHSFKGANTIRFGGWGEEGTKVSHIDQINPKSFLRFKNVAGSSEHASGLDNQGIIARSIYNNSKGEAGWIGKAFGVDAPVFNAHLLSRATAAKGTMRNFTPRVGEGTMNFIRQTAPDMAEALGEDFTFTSGAQAAMAQMMAGNGSLTQKLLGRMSTSIPMSPEMEEFGMASRPAFMAARNVAMENLKIMDGGVKGMWSRATTQATEKAAAKAAESGAVKVGEEAVVKEGAGLLAKKAGGMAITREFATLGAQWGAAQAGDWIPGAFFVVNAAMTVYTAYTLAKIGAKLTKDLIIDPIAEETKKGFMSFTGQISKSPFGMGYKDNEVAATSRQRGVMAIQNSRLNARSALGSEAAYLHQHFG